MTPGICNALGGRWYKKDSGRQACVNPSASNDPFWGLKTEYIDVKPDNVTFTYNYNK
jgi:hypothetical protein